MRLFVAVRVDDVVVGAAVNAANTIRRRLGSDVTARWVSQGEMHLTVRFIGLVGDDRVAAVLDALRPPLALAPFQIELGDCGVFPPSGPPRVLWIGLGTGLPSLRAMHEEFDRRLAPHGYEPESRPFSAHLTVARIKDAPRAAARRVRETVQAIRPDSASCQIRAATVFQSLLLGRRSAEREGDSSQGSKHVPLFDVPCAP